MKLAIRLFALSVVVAGAAAASVSSSSTRLMASSQVVSAKLPVPACGPGVPTCPTKPGPTR
jgi:hypothetical protein